MLSTDSIYLTCVQAKHAVDYGHKISTFQHNLQCIMPCYTGTKHCKSC